MIEKGLFSILLLVVGSQAHLSGFEQFYRTQVNPFATQESLDHNIRIQSALKVSEVALRDKDGCLRRAMCVMGTIPEEELPKMSIAAGAENFLHILQRMIAVAGMTGLTKEDLPNMRQILARFVFTGGYAVFC